jgi:molybdate transport system substrate-binding protein
VRRTALGLIPLLVLLAACSAGGSGSPSRPLESPTDAIELTVFAAASLRSALERAAIVYEAATPGRTLVVSTDSSATLATQIAQGAPADVFLAADIANPGRLADEGFADGQPVAFAGNELTIIVPPDNPAGLVTPFDIARAGVRVIAAGDEVPITKYATQLIDNLAGEPGAPEDFAAAYAANIVSREDNVGAVRSKIELGEGDAAIVYVTDAVASDEVVTIDMPSAANVPATYAGVVVRSSPNVEAGRAFLDWLAGPAGQEILAPLGFLPPS